MNIIKKCRVRTALLNVMTVNRNCLCQLRGCRFRSGCEPSRAIWHRHGRGERALARPSLGKFPVMTAYAFCAIRSPQLRCA